MTTPAYTDYEKIVSDIKNELILADPELEPALQLESESLVKLIETVAYRLMDMQIKVNSLT